MASPYYLLHIVLFTPSHFNMGNAVTFSDAAWDFPFFHIPLFGLTAKLII